MAAGAANLREQEMSEKTPPEAPEPESAPLFTGVERITLAVHDLAAAEAIYTRLLGRHPSWRRVDRAGGTAGVQYDLDNMSLELAAVIGTGVWGKQIKAFLDARGEGILALFLTTNDIEAAAKELTGRGLPTIALPANEGVGSDGSARGWRHSMMPREQSRNMSIIACQRMDDGSERWSAPLREGVRPEAAISRLDHVVVMTSDADACIRLFGEQFGIRLALDHSKPEWGVRQLFFRLGGVTIEVVQSLDPAKAPRVDFLWGLAWKVDDIRATHARLVAEGADMSEVTRGRKKGTEVATVRKPTGGVPTILIGALAEV
jgi:catechol 2,3-dioxygenase-like lactoylglutathione lyase family enzyme